ncbi:hypothetical protein RRG08_053394 [Elysia crispata]|uniref:Uncharacterized protein n=1 Tax=Elysia crispata TaxID=231223 RepID=A0AAE1B6T7_9GAST|nr:hypothetical protein RRG08_053394 [Elysia crispata]
MPMGSQERRSVNATTAKRLARFRRAGCRDLVASCSHSFVSRQLSHDDEQTEETIESDENGRRKLPAGPPLWKKRQTQTDCIAGVDLQVVRPR